GRLADRQPGHLFAVVGIRHDHPAVGADREQSMADSIYCEARRPLARRQRPDVLDLALAQIDLSELARSFEIDVEPALAIDNGELGVAAQRDGGDFLAEFRVNDADL